MWQVVRDNPLSEAESLESDYRPYSPIRLAISAILALIPLLRSEAARGTEAKTARRNQAHDYATACLNSIDVETELIESMILPQDALQKHFVEHGRAQFHPRVPLSLESILARPACFDSIRICTTREYDEDESESWSGAGYGVGYGALR